MHDTRRTALTYVIGLGAVMPAVAVAQDAKQASAPGSSAGPVANVGPQTPIEWFVAGVAVGVLITLAWIKIRGSKARDVSAGIGGSAAPSGRR